jgi:VanZ family protein
MNPSTMNSRPHRAFVWLWLAAALIWMAFMYGKSAQPYSQQDLRPQLATIISQDRLIAILPHISFSYDGNRITYEKPYDMAEFFIRKAGHVAEYAILAWLWTRTLKHIGSAGPTAKHPTARAFLLAAAISILYASLDEWHQTFVPGRSGHAIDVAIDAGGILLTGVLELIISALRRFHTEQKKK